MRTAMLEKKRDSKAGLAEATPHYHGHRERLRQRFREAGTDALSDYELLELLLFRALPRRDVKPLAKIAAGEIRLVRRSHCRAEARLAEVKGLGDAGITELKIVQAAASRLAARRGEKAAGAVIVVERARLLPHRAGLRRPRAVPRAVPRQAQPAHRRRSAADRHRRSHAGLSARSGQARAGTVGDRDRAGAQSPVRRSDAVARRRPDDASRSSRWRSRSALRCTITSSSARRGTRA